MADNDRRYIIDAASLIRHPELLAYAGSGLVIPRSALSNLAMNKVVSGGRYLRQALTESIGSGTVVARPTSAEESQIREKGPQSDDLDAAQRETAAVAMKYEKEAGSEKITVVTSDERLKRFLSSAGIATISAREFLANEKDVAHPGIIRFARKARANQQKMLLISLVVAIALSGSAIWLVTNSGIVMDNVPVWGPLLVIPVVGVSMYGYRQRFRVSYGIFEFSVGVYMGLRAVYPWDGDLSNLDTITLIGGLYVMVRGLNNLSKGLMGSPWESVWKRIFGQIG